MGADALNAETGSGPASLSARVAKGAVWILGGGLSARLLGAANTIILARLLAPEDIGLVAVATVAMQLLQGFTDIGVSQTVVKFQQASRDDMNTLFTFSALRGLAIGLVLAIAAPAVGALYGDPRMTGVFLAIALHPIILGLINPRFFEFERELRFSREFVATVVNKFAGVAVSISIAILYRSYWAIILGLLAGGFVQLTLSYLMRPFLPRLSFKSMRRLVGFTGWLAGVSFVAALNNKLDVPIIARLVGAGGAGHFHMGMQLSELAAGQMANPLTRAIYPGLALMQEDETRMRRAFLRGVEALAMFAMPAAIGFAFIADGFTALILGEKWRAAAGVIEMLAPVIGLQALFFGVQSYAVARGLPKLVFFRELIFFILRLPVFVWATIAHGLAGAVTAAAAMGLLHVGLNLALYRRVAARPFWEPLLAARRPLGAAGVMCAGLIAFQASGADWRQAEWVGLLADIAIGAGLYIAALTALWRLEGAPDDMEQRAVDFLRARLRR